MSKDSGNGIWYLLIFFFVIMIFVPPLFRFAYPKAENISNESPENSNTSMLSCKKNTQDYEYLIETQYNNDKLSVITFRKNQTSQQNSDQTNESDNQDWFDILSNMNPMGKVTQGNQTTIVFDFEKNKYDEELLVNYIKSITDEKKYYENQGFTCQTDIK